MAMAQRHGELVFLTQRYRDCLAGKGSVVVVRGMVACGKTELLHTFARQFAENDTLVLNAACPPAERNTPLGVMGQIFHHPELRTESLAGAIRQLDRLVATELPFAAAPLRLQRALCAALLDLAAQRPLVLAIDDLHDADKPSLQCLLYLTSRLSMARILVVLTERVQPESNHPLLSAELRRPPYCHELWLTPLNRAGVATVLGERLGLPATHQLITDFHEVSGGNPLLLRGLVDDYRNSASAGTGQLAAGEAFGEAVANCVYRAGASMLRTAQAIAVFDTDSPTAVARLAGLTPAVASQAASALAAAGLLRGYEFRHPRARTAVLATMDADQHADLHHRAAQLLAELGAPVRTVAHHLLTARRTEQWGVTVLRQAGQDALANGDPQFAQRCLRVARESSQDAAERANLTAELAEIEWQLNPPAALRYLDQLTTDVRANRLTGSRALQPVKYLLWQGRVAEAGTLLAEFDRNPAVGLDRADVCTERAWLTYLFPKQHSAHQETEPTAGSTDTPLRNLDQLASGALDAALGRYRGGESVSDAERVLQCWHPDDISLAPAMAAAMSLVVSDEFDKAVFWCDTLVEQAAARSARAWQGLFTAIRAAVHLRRGDLVSAERDGTQALVDLPPAGWGIAVGLPLGVLLTATTELGRLDKAQACLALPVPEAMFDSSCAVGYFQARGQYYLATGRADSALRDFQTSGALLAESHLDLPALTPWRTDAARALLVLGRREQARALVTEQLAMLGESDARTHGISMHVLAAASEPGERPMLLMRAVEVLEGCGARLDLAYALADLGQALGQLGQDRKADASLRRAGELATECGANRLAKVLGTAEYAPHAEPAECGDPLDKLSDAERRVVGLVAQGHTNQQIARRLHVTVSTVEQHLTRVYRKLNIRRRRDLRPLLPCDLISSA